MAVGGVEAKNTLDALLDRVERGEEIVITRHGKPESRRAAAAAEGVPIHGTDAKRGTSTRRRQRWGKDKRLALIKP